LDHRDRNGGRTHRRCDPAAWELFCGLWLDEARPSIPRLWEIVAAEAVKQNWAWPALRTVQRKVVRDLDPKCAAAGRDPKRFRDRCLPHIERDWSQVPAMGCWVADHRQFDVRLPCRVGLAGQEWRWERPWLTLFLDARSWYPTGWTIAFDSPNGNRVMETFVAAVSAHGQPAAVYLDNGKDFRMHRFSGGRPGRGGSKDKGIVLEKQVGSVLSVLGIEARFALPYNARAKIVEPFFGLVAEWFDKAWETYCGPSTDQRPERLKVLEKQGAGEFAERGYTLEAFCQAFEHWIKDDYALRQSPSAAAEGLSPAEAFFSQKLRPAGFAPTRPSAEALALLLMPSVPVVVRQNGIYVHPFGRHYWADELEDRRCGSGRDLRRKVVYRYRPTDDSCIYVFDATSDKFLCIARPYAGSGIAPLVGDGQIDEQQRLSDALALQRGLGKRYRQEVRDLRSVGAAHLESVRAAGSVLGKIVRPQLPPAAAPIIRLHPQFDAAGAAARKLRQQTQEQTRHQAALDTFAAALPTGTDDIAPPPVADPLDLLKPFLNEDNEDMDVQGDAHEPADSDCQ
jgi:transposase InsO family protein